MTCREFADFMDGYVSGELSADVRHRFEQHLRVCPNCVAYLGNYRATPTISKLGFDDDTAQLPSNVPEDLVRAILAARRR